MLTYRIVSNSNPALFSAGPAIDNNGTLTYTPAPNATGTATIGVTVQDNGGTDLGGVDTSATLTFKITVVASKKLTAAGPADSWVGVKSSADVGTRFDLKAEVLKNGVVVAKGQLDCVSLGSSSAAFDKYKALMADINLTALSLPASLVSGDTVSLRVSVRIAQSGYTRTKGTATLWFNIPASTAENSHLHAKIGGSAIKYNLVGSSSNPAVVRVEDRFGHDRPDTVGRRARGQERRRQSVQALRDLDGRHAVRVSRLRATWIPRGGGLRAGAGLRWTCRGA